jgi:hypothetical protein
MGNVISYRDEVFNETKLASYFGRFQYKLMDRYLLTGTIRRDGSSNFGKDTIVGELFQPLVNGFFLKNFIANVKGIDLLS